MDDEPKFVRVGRSHPSCCKQEGCEFERKPNSEYCVAHPYDYGPKDNKGLRQYVLNNTLGKRAGVFLNNPGSKSIAEELALLRAILELVLNKVKTEDDAILFIDRIDKSANTISKLIMDSQKIEERNKDLLDRATVFAIGDAILAILVDVVPQDTLMVVTEKIYEAITTGIGK
jgi:hypothetical protein